MGGGGKKESSGETDQLGQYSRALFNETSPLRQQIENQGLEALKTGGIGAQIPMIARAVESSKSQLATDLQSARDDQAKYRLNGTPFGQSIIQQARIAGNQGISQIPTNYAQNFISMLPSFVSGITGMGLQGQGQAANAQTSLYGSYNNGYSQILSAGIPGMTGMTGNIVSGAAKAAL